MVEKVNNMPNGHATSESKKVIDNSNELNFIRHKLEKFQTTIIKDVEKRIEVVVDEVMQELRQRDLQAKEFKSFAQASTWSNRTAINDQTETPKPSENESDNENDSSSTSTINSCQQSGHDNRSSTDNENKSRKKRVNSLPDKIFITRESYLTALLKVDHMRSIYHIFHIIFIVLCLHTIAHDYFVEGSINLGLGTMKVGFAGIQYVLGIWLVQHMFVFLLYYAFRTWMYLRVKLQRQSSLQRFWSHSCLITYIGSQLVFGYVASALCLKLNLPFPSASVLLLETTRLLMKMHAFVRTNCSRVLSGKLKSDDDINHNAKDATILAPFSWYVYFLFAPTLLYRDSYPRTSTIRWKYALERLVEAFAVAFLFSYLHERHMRVHFGDYGREPISIVELIVKFNSMFMPSILILLCGFFLILHAWLNFTAELLRFGDRMFYMDWWTSSNYGVYYRKWNVVVHDWLYEYIYKDCYKYVFRGSKVASSLMVFTVSALVHEHVLGFAMQLFFPVMFVFFGIVGVLCVFMTRGAPKNIGNIFLWFSLIFGIGVMISLYYMEYYARQNCNIVNKDWIDYLLPAVWKCRR